MPCDLCRNIIDRENVPHVIRVCEGCGREMHVVESGEDGMGIRIRAGDRFVIPAGWLKISANPLQGTCRLTVEGLQWFANLIFLDRLPRKCEEITSTLADNERVTAQVLSESEIFKGLDWHNDEHTKQILEKLEEHKGSVEWYACLFRMFNDIAQKAIAEGDAVKAAWAATCSERFRSMLVFKQALEEVVWMGHSAKRLVELLKVWDGNKDNSDEEFWQHTFNEHSYVFSQVFSVPIVFIQDKAYVGGMGIDRKDAKLVDYLFSGDTSGEAILIEIKTPATKLLGSMYRKGVYKPSAEITGALVQAADYRASLIENLRAVTDNLEKRLSVFNPRCLIVAGNAGAELIDEKKRRSFELFRSSLHGVEVATYDELFRKMEVLASLFSLVRKKAQ
jgi:hypothetical protein